jgi:hypothetical protein
MGYWQALTPDELLGRVNATRRAINRTAAALGALIAGLLVGLIGDRTTLIGVIIVFRGGRAHHSTITAARNTQQRLTRKSSCR